MPARAEVLYITAIPELLEGTRKLMLVSPLYQPLDRLVARLNFSKLSSKSESNMISGSHRVSSFFSFESRLLFWTALRARLRLVKVFLGGQTVTRGKGRSVMGQKVKYKTFLDYFLNQKKIFACKYFIK